MTDAYTEYPAEDPSLRRAVLVLKRWGGLVVVAALVAAALVYVSQRDQTSYYRSSGTIELTDEVATGITVAGSKRDALLQIQAQQLIITSQATRDQLDAALGDRASELRSISVNTPEDTPVITITVEADSPEVAKDALSELLDLYVAGRIAEQQAKLEAELEPLRAQQQEQEDKVRSLTEELNDTRATATQDEISVLEKRTADALDRLDTYDTAIQEREFLRSTADGEVRVISGASDPVEVAGSPIRQAAQVGVLVLLLGAGLVVLVSRLRGRLLLLDEVRAAAGGLPVLATVPRFRRRFRDPSEALVVGKRSARREAEGFRYLRTSLEVATDRKSPLVVAITSSGANEGKTVTSANLALAVARGGRSAALLDGDLLGASIQEMFDTDADNAFAGLLKGDIELDRQWFGVRTPEESLTVLVDPKGSMAPERFELSSEDVEDLFGRLGRRWDTIVVDCPPVLAVSDSVVLAGAADATLIVVRLGQTTRRDLEKTLIQLEQAGVRIAGLVVTFASEKSESYYGYGYEYGRQ